MKILFFLSAIDNNKNMVYLCSIKIKKDHEKFTYNAYAAFPYDGA